MLLGLNSDNKRSHFWEVVTAPFPVILHGKNAFWASEHHLMNVGVQYPVQPLRKYHCTAQLCQHTRQNIPQSPCHGKRRARETFRQASFKEKKVLYICVLLEKSPVSTSYTHKTFCYFVSSIKGNNLVWSSSKRST